MLKLYIHWDGEPAFTKVAKLGPGATVLDLRFQCWEALATREPAAAAAAAAAAVPGAGPASLVLVSGPKRRPLPHAAALTDILSPGDDVFFAVSQETAAAGGSPPAPAAVPASGMAASAAASGADRGATAPMPAGAAAANAPSSGSTAPEAAAGGSGSVAGASTSISNSNSNSSTGAGADACMGSGQGKGGGGAGTAAAGKAAANTPAAAVEAAAASMCQKEALLPLVHAFWQRAEEAAAQKNFRNASEILEQALLLAPEPSSAAASSAAATSSSSRGSNRSHGSSSNSNNNSSSSSSSCAHSDTLQRLARVWLAAGNPGRAVRWALRAAEAAPGNAAVLELAGDCLREGGRPREAAVHYQSALEVLEEAQERDGARGAGGGGGGAAAVGSGPQPHEAPPSEAQLRVRLALAACLYDIPGSASPPYTNQDLAASLVMAALEADPGCGAALHLYGRIALARGLADDALRVALRLAVAAPQRADAKRLLAECLPDAAACQQLYAELNVPHVRDEQEEDEGGQDASSSSGSSSSSSGASSSAAAAGSVSAAAALGFVATAVKDHGKVGSCIALLRRASALQPCCASYALNHVHALELTQALQPALAAAAAFCRRAAGPAAQLAGVPLKALVPLLTGLPPLHRAADLDWYLASPPPPPPPSSQPAPAPDAATPTAAAPATASAPATARAAAATAVAAAAAPARSVCYSPDQLDALALLFTAAKLLFVGGALGAAAALAAEVEPLRRASSVELHTTLIRNEAAYFGCVQQLLADPHTPPQPPQPPQPQGPAGPEEEGGAAPAPGAEAGPRAGAAAQGNAAAEPTATAGAGAGGAAAAGAATARPLYLCGDSHCLSAAWRLVTLRGERRLLRPQLVTGCKVWHLRPESVFYPKAQFEAAMRLLPPGAQVRAPGD
ncbi:hypothetical protein CHLRE_06g293650v5 [Chlamydomonas reinhardtii]|uniref:Uncharacterized protein n=1 Tax=Chlamydomonas reinhardtii TaxID=3055 RepID=A0A2K3DQF2_CHLRE|nr:uncharacterized protein CHLRE_06g293650v5 [Chlamydomonas reinhardtii]PNW82776.1 hypothetical protein CHLRE_06g293650v5 [Chlamydomonas reinhardtii]